MKSITRTVVALLALSFPAAVQAETPAPGAPDAPRIKVHKVKPTPVLLPAAKRVEISKVERAFPWEGEELYYAVEISGADAARASLQAGARKTTKGVTYIPITARAISHGFFAKSYPLDDKADTFINVKNGQPIKSDKVIREDGTFRRYDVRYDPGGYVAKVNREQREKGDKAVKKRNYLRAVPDTIHDGLSWVYALRGEKLQKGDKYTYYIYDGWKLSRLVVTVVGKETVWTSVQEYKSIKVDVERTVLDSSWENKKGKRGAPKLKNRDKPYYFSSIYFSDDALHIPVKIFVTSQKADSELKLVKYVAPKK